MRVKLHYQAGKQILSFAGMSLDMLTLKADEAQELRDNTIRSMFPLTGERYIASEKRKAVERAARKAERDAQRAAQNTAELQAISADMHSVLAA